MENFGEQLNQFEKYLQEQNQEYKKHLDEKLAQFKLSLKKEEQSYFEEGLKDITKTAEKTKEDAVKRYKESIEKIKDTKDGLIKVRRLRMVEDDLNRSFEIAQKMIGNYIRDFNPQ